MSREAVVRISALASAGGVPLATVKYYLREGLLPPGRLTSATQAVYGEQHLARLRLVRALTETAGLSVAAVRQVLGGLSAADLHGALGAAQHALPPNVEGALDPQPAREIVSALGWQVHEDSAAFRQLGAALAAVTVVGMAMSMEQALVYGRAVEQVAEYDVRGVPTQTTEAAVEYAVVGTVLYEPVLLAMRRLAQQSLSQRGLAGRRPGLENKDPAT